MKKLFWDDPYQTTCTAIVVAVDGTQVQLDQSIFYAFSGGQESDSGTIGGISVVEAVKKGDKENIIDITYTLADKPLFGVGDIVSVVIDGVRREKLRRLHSAAHIVYYIAFDVLGKQKLIGSHASPVKTRMDFLYDTPLQHLLPEIEAKVNVFLAERHPIVCSFDSEKKDLRWWTCGKWKMPCGGTHVRNTSEIGSLQLKRKNIGAGKERIEILLA